MVHRRRSTLSCCVALAFVAVIVAGITPAARADDVSFVQPVATSAADVAVLETMSLQVKDLRPEAVIRPYASSTMVRSQVSLNLCGAPFASEQLRAGRLQVGAYVDDDEVLSVEGIVYRDDAAARQALDEVARAKATCPTGYAASGVAGQAPTKTRFRSVPARFAAPPGVQRLTLMTTQSFRTGETADLVEVFQRRGRIVVALYASPYISGHFIARGVGGISGLADELAQRLSS